MTAFHLWISIHAPLRGRHYPHESSAQESKFQSTPPCGGDGLRYGELAALRISIHAPLRGRRTCVEGIKDPSIFQSTPPCGGDAGPGHQGRETGISIHAPLRGRRNEADCPGQCHAISIHAPLRGRRINLVHLYPSLLFQSTPPCGGDPEADIFNGCRSHFNPRPLAGATRPP